MNSKILMTTIVGAVIAFMLGYLVWGLLLMDYFATNSIHYDGLSIEPPRLWAIFVHDLVGAFLLSWLFTRMGVNSMNAGLQTGATIYFLFATANSLLFYSMMNLYSSPAVMVVDIIAVTVVWGIVGGVIGMMRGRNTKPATS